MTEWQPPDTQRPAQNRVDDRSNGWEAVASQLLALRSNIGRATIRDWIATLPRRGAVLDLGCGGGVPVSEALLEAGFDVYGIDAAPSLVAAFNRRFPSSHVACEPVEDSRFFDRSFDAAVAVGLVFLLPEESQRALIRRVAAALNPQGRFLFSAPVETGSWTDIMTGGPSLSLGDDAYKAVLADAGLSLVGEYVDEGESHYYDVSKV